MDDVEIRNWYDETGPVESTSSLHLRLDEDVIEQDLGYDCD